MSIQSSYRLVANVFGKVPLRTVLIVPFVLQIFTAVGLVGYLSFKNGQKAVNDLANRLMSEISARTQQHLDSYLKTPQSINQFNADAFRLDLLDLQRPATIERHFWNQIKAIDSVSYIYLVNKQGGLLSVGRLSSGTITIETTQGLRPGHYLVYTTDSQGHRKDLVKVGPIFDPRVSPWYKAVIKVGKPTWHKIVSYPISAELSVALPAVRPLYDKNGTLQGVLATDIVLSQINDFLGSLKISRSGQIFIIERSGELVASSTAERPFTKGKDGKKWERLRAEQTRVPLIRDATKYLTSHFGDLTKIQSSEQLNFIKDGKRQFLQVAPFTDKFGLDWLIVVVVPESDFMEQINANTRTTIVLCISALIAATVLGILTSRWVVKPILHLNTAAKDIAKGEWDKTVEIYRSDELGELAKSFNSMAGQLQASFATLEAKNAEMKALNEALSESESRLAQFLDAMPVGVFVVDANGLPYYTNQTGKQILGQGIVESTTADQLLNTYQVYLAGCEQPYPKERAPVFKALQGESVTVDDIEIRRPDKIIPIEVSGTPIYDESGHIAYAIVAFADITERKHADKLIEEYSRTLETQVQERTKELEQEIAERRRTEEALRQSEAQNRAIISAIPDLMFRVNGEGIYLGYVATRDRISLMPSDFNPTGKPMWEFLPPDVAERQMQHLQRVLVTGKSQIYEQQIWVRGKVQYEEVRVVVSGENEVLFMIRDITDRKQAEIALRQKNEELANTLQQLQATQQELIQSEKMAALGQLIAGVAHEINTPLGAIQASIGNVTTAIDNSIRQLPLLFQQLSPQQQTDFFALLEAARQNKVSLSFREERQLKRALKKELETLEIADADTIADTLVQMGITQNIAPFLPLLHTYNNTFIFNTAYNLYVQYANSQNILLAIKKASKIVFALKSYARQNHSDQMVQAQVQQGIDVVLTLYQNQLKKGVEVIKNYEDVPAILCYPEELNQIWTNLIHNALQAMNYKGRLEIAVSGQYNQILVQITDSGCGISEGIKYRIFDPFFTTKPAGEGSGLGLNIVKKIIDKHQGAIEVESEPGRTTFSVWLPIK